MQFEHPLLRATLVRRYKRFLADVVIEGGEEVTVHCPNPGGMTGLMEPGSELILSDRLSPKRKLRYSWELVRVGATWVCINTGLANSVVHEGILGGLIPELSGASRVETEVPYGQGSRIDLLLHDQEDQLTFVEVKSVTLAVDEVALFPDSVTARGKKHLEELGRMVEAGHKAVIFYLVNREDCSMFRPAKEIDPAYAEACEKARSQGVACLSYQARVSPAGIEVGGKISTDLTRLQEPSASNSPYPSR